MHVYTNFSEEIRRKKSPGTNGLTKPKSITSRNYSLNNIENFKRALGAESWENLYVCADTQESYNIFSSKFHELFNLFFPLNTVKFNKKFHYKEKWFSQGLAVSRREKICLDNIAAKCPTPTNIKKFKDYRNLYNKITKAAKKSYFEDELSKNKSNLKKTWSLIRQAVKLKSSKSDDPLNTF